MPWEMSWPTASQGGVAIMTCTRDARQELRSIYKLFLEHSGSIGFERNRRRRVDRWSILTFNYSQDAHIITHDSSFPTRAHCGSGPSNRPSFSTSVRDDLSVQSRRQQPAYSRAGLEYLPDRGEHAACRPPRAWVGASWGTIDRNRRLRLDHLATHRACP
jgi:hypothetical protein